MSPSDRKMFIRALVVAVCGGILINVLGGAPLWWAATASIAASAAAFGLTEVAIWALNRNGG